MLEDILSTIITTIMSVISTILLLMLGYYLEEKDKELSKLIGLFSKAKYILKSFNYKKPLCFLASLVFFFVVQSLYLNFIKNNYLTVKVKDEATHVSISGLKVELYNGSGSLLSVFETDKKGQVKIKTKRNYNDVFLVKLVDCTKKYNTDSKSFPLSLSNFEDGLNLSVAKR